MKNRKYKNNDKASKTAQRIITTGGITPLPGMTELPDIILQQPELFFFDIRQWMNRLNAAKQIEISDRSGLYDMYESAMLDLHLRGIINKRRIGISRTPIEFRRDGEPVPEVNEQIRAPWFRKFLKSTFDAELYGFTLYQFYKDQKGWIDYQKVDHRHVDPVRGNILQHEHDHLLGLPFEMFPNTLFIGEKRDVGMMAAIVPYVLYKRNNMGDWAKFCQIFGIPIREYTYDAGDEEARKKLLVDARQQGAAAVYIHPKSSTLNLIESGNKTGSADLFRGFNDYCDSQMSICVLGNTLTTDAQENGTQSLGKVHKEEEDEIKADDRDNVLDILNYHMTDIFENLGIRVQGGEFVYAKEQAVNVSQQADVVMKMYAIGLPMSDDYLYKTFSIQKPENYEEQKKKMEEEAEINKRLKQANMEAYNTPMPEEGKPGASLPSRWTLFNRFMNFFAQAPNKDDGALKW